MKSSKLSRSNFFFGSMTYTVSIFESTMTAAFEEALLPESTCCWSSRPMERIKAFCVATSALKKFSVLLSTQFRPSTREPEAKRR